MQRSFNFFEIQPISCAPTSTFNIYYSMFEYITIIQPVCPRAAKLIPFQKLILHAMPMDFYLIGVL